MSHMVRSACGEFPNDNPGLHDGARWVGLDVTGEPSCLLPRLAQPRSVEVVLAVAAIEVVEGGLEVPEASAAPVEMASVETLDVVSESAPAFEDFDDELTAVGEPIEIVDDMVFEGTVDESEAAPGAFSEPAAEDAFLTLVSALEETALSLGASPEQGACIRALFGVTRWDAVELGAPALDALVAAQILVEGGSRRANGLSRTREFTEQVLAWQGILRGESEDFALCTALDEWAADVVARVLGSPARAEGIRRELRRRGVAAYGLVARAA
jgi:hypothetical protein